MFRKLILSLIVPICLLILVFAMMDKPTVHALDVSGSIASDTIWTVANSPYVITGDLTIEPGVHLTIEADVDVIFVQAATLFVEGHLQVEGTNSNPVEFTPQNNTTEVEKYYIDINETGSLMMNHAELEVGMIPFYIYGDSPKQVFLQNTLITSSGNYFVLVNANALHRLQMENVTFGGPGLKTVQIAFDDNLSGPFEFTENVTLTKQLGLDGYVFGGPSSDEDEVIPEGITMTLESGVTLLLGSENYYTHLTVNGHLQVNGTVADPVQIIANSRDNTLIHVNETGSVMMNHAELEAEMIPFYIYGESTQPVVLHNAIMTGIEDNILLVEANALHRLKMEDVTFAGAGLKTVLIDFGGEYYGPFEFAEDVTLSPQSGLDGYWFGGPSKVSEGITLTLEAGTSMLFNEYSYQDFNIDGHLQMNGTVTNPVTVTTLIEDKSFHFLVSKTGSIDMNYGSINSSEKYSTPLVIFGDGDNEIELKNSLISNDEDYLVVVGADALHRLKMDNMRFEGQGQKGVAVDFGGYNNLDPITMTENVVLTPQIGLDAYLFDGEVRVPEEITLTLKSGTKIQMHQQTGPLQVEGTLISHGTAQNPVELFTGPIYESPSTYWNGIQVQGGNVQLDHTILMDASFGLHSISGTVQIENSQIISSTQAGMKIEGGTVTAVCTQFHNNQTGINVPESVSPTISISQSVFENNGTDVKNLGDTAVSATNNWWGNAAGPQVGTDVIGDVIVAPLLLWEPACISQIPDYQIYLPMVIRP